MKIKTKTLLIFIAIPLLIGGLAALISSGSMDAFAALEKPPLSPPDRLFPVVWTILYVLMGISSYLVFTSGESRESISAALKLYAVQLIFNFFWTIWFFNLHFYFFAFLWLVALWLLIGATITAFSRISKPAAFLMIPYLLWVTFAGYLNLGIALLN